MDVRIVALIFFTVAVVFNGIASTVGASSRSWLLTGISDATQVINESNSTKDELKIAVLFYLYTPSNLDTAVQIYLDDEETLSTSSFDTSLPTRIVIHGWQNDANSTVSTVIRKAFLAEGDYNVFVVDWSAYAEKDYVTARRKIVSVGGYVGEMIDFLVDQRMDIETLILMGHSLGAHISGVACRSSKNTVPILIGFDPAGPLFYTRDTTARLRSTDAAFVQIIHTNAGELGYNANLGDVDFWPNGGSIQAGCTLDVVGSCSHGRSYLYFAESIPRNSTKFVANACTNYVTYELSKCPSTNFTYMGGAIPDTTASGSYYLKTNSASPYAKGR